jgi:hypothetical protein
VVAVADQGQRPGVGDLCVWPAARPSKPAPAAPAPLSRRLRETLWFMQCAPFGHQPLYKDRTWLGSGSTAWLSGMHHNRSPRPLRKRGLRCWTAPHSRPPLLVDAAYAVSPARASHRNRKKWWPQRAHRQG